METAIINLIGFTLCGGLLTIWGLDNFEQNDEDDPIQKSSTAIEEYEVNPDTSIQRPGKFEVFV